jgi:hypothetical protein
MNRPVDVKGTTAQPIRKSAPYLFHAQTTSLCEVCLKLVPAKILIEGEDVFYQKRCQEHGVQKTTGRSRRRRTRSAAVHMIAAYAPITSSIRVWRSSRSTRRAIFRALYALRIRR